jgi:WD40 repeat protein/serine/threonine protein kinase
MSQSLCPKSERLFAWSEGRLLPSETEAIELHITECTRCQNTLQERDISDPLVASLRPTRRIDLGFDAEPTLIETLDRAKRWPPFVPCHTGEQCEANQTAAHAAPEDFKLDDSLLELLAPPLLPGSIGRMGRYHVLNVVGSGGMGIVFRACDPNLNRDVAIKVLKSAFASDAAVRQRFLREARAVSSVQHPNICAIYEVGDYEGRLFLALEYIESGNLARMLAGEPQSPRVAAKLIETLARAMQHVHESGLVHRDLKPANILMRAEAGRMNPSSDSGSATPRPIGERSSAIDDRPCLTVFRPLITDFGLAKSATDDATHTRTDLILGTPCYMAPEQAGGQHKPVGPAADIYALGAILFEMLTGHPPFRGETSLETVQKVLFDDPPPLQRLQPKLPRDLVTICKKCLQKDPTRRYATAQALAHDLNRFLDGAPILARPATSSERLVQWAKRRPAIAALGVLTAFVLLLLALATSVVTRERLSARKDRSRAILRESELKRERYAADIHGALRFWEAGNVNQLAELLDNYAPQSNEEDLRGFEWYYLRRLCHDPAHILREHDGEVYAAAFSPDGKRLVSGGQDGRLVCWDLPTRRVTAAWRAHDDCVNTVSFSQDGRLLVTGSCDKSLKVWDAASGSQSPIRSIRVGAPLGASFSPDGRTIASWGEADGVRLWDAKTGTELGVLADQGKVNSIAFSPDSRRLATARHEAGGLVWDLETKRRIGKLRDPDDNPFHSVAFSHDGMKIAGGAWEGTVRIYEGTGGAAIASWQALPGRIDSLSFSAGDQMLCVSGASAAARLWDIRSGKLHCVFPGHGGHVWKAALAPNSEWVATASSDHTVRIWNVKDTAACRQLHAVAPVVSSLVFGRDGRLVVSGFERSSGTITMWDPEQDQTLCELTPGSGPLTSVVCSHDLNTLAMGQEGSIRLFDTSTGSERTLIHGHPSSALELVFSPDDSTLAAFAGDEVLLWDARTCELKTRLQNKPMYVTTLAFAPEGKTLLTGAREINLWDPATGQLSRALGTHSDRAECAAFSADGTVLATGDLNGSVKLWDLAGGTERATLLGHSGGVTSLAFTPDGKTLASGGADMTIRLWRVSDGRELLVLQGHADPISRLAFSPNGSTLVSAAGSHDGPGTILVWPADASTQLPLREQPAFMRRSSVNP